VRVTIYATIMTLTTRSLGQTVSQLKRLMMSSRSYSILTLPLFLGRRKL